jgi:hypothetical protein
MSRPLATNFRAILAPVLSDFDRFAAEFASSNFFQGFASSGMERIWGLSYGYYIDKIDGEQVGLEVDPESQIVKNY